MFELWLTKLNRENFNPAKRSLLCSEHFEECFFDYSGRYVKLRIDAVPSIFKSNEMKSSSNVKSESVNNKMTYAESNTETYESGSEKIIFVDLVNDEIPFSRQEEVKSKAIHQPEPRVNEYIAVEHSYCTRESPHEDGHRLKKKIISLKAKLKKSHQKTWRLKKTVLSLKGLLKSLKSKNFISDSCEDILEESFSGRVTYFLFNNHFILTLLQSKD